MVASHTEVVISDFTVRITLTQSVKRFCYRALIVE